jgi:phage FluMu gp28-like protein
MGLRQSLVHRVPLLCELRNTPFNQQWQVLKYLMTRLPRLMFSSVDAGGNGSWLAEQAFLEGGGGDSVERVMLTVADYRSWWPKFKRSMENRLLELPRDLDVRADFGMVRRIGGVPRVPDVRQAAVSGSKGARHADAAIAILLAHEACSKAQDIFERMYAYGQL